MKLLHYPKFQKKSKVDHRLSGKHRDLIEVAIQDKINTALICILVSFFQEHTFPADTGQVLDLLHPDENIWEAVFQQNRNPHFFTFGE